MSQICCFMHILETPNVSSAFNNDDDYKVRYHATTLNTDNINKFTNKQLQMERTDLHIIFVVKVKMFDKMTEWVKIIQVFLGKFPI